MKLNRPFSLPPVIAAVGLALFASPLPTRAGDIPGPFWNVASLTGAARCMIGTNAVQPLTRGQTVGPGTLVQLAGGSSKAQLVAEPDGPRIQMYPNSVVVFSNATSEVTGTATNSPTVPVLQLELRAGRIVVKADTTGAGQITEVKLPGGLVRSQSAQYSLTDQGVLAVYSGKALIALTNMPSVAEVPAGYELDSMMQVVKSTAPPPSESTTRTTPQPSMLRPTEPLALPHRAF